MKVIVANWDDVKKNGAAKKTYVRWEAQREQRIVDLMRRLSGTDGKLEDADYTRPIIGAEGGHWILPRLAPGSGDRNLAGGSGVGWGDRNDIAESLDGPMRTAGLSRSAPLSRISHRMPIRGPFNVPADDLDATAPERRVGLLRALASIGNAGGEVDFYLFHIRDGSPAKVRQEMVRLLGVPHYEDGALLGWSDGLKVRLVAAQSGPLGQRLPYYELPQNGRVG